MDDLRDFNKRPVAEQTRANFHADMISANNRRCAKMLSTGEAGYDANKAEQEKTKENSPPDTDANRDQPTQQTQAACWYCWTHGVTFSPAHTSKTCKKPEKGHKRRATLRNMLGGNPLVPRKRSEKVNPVFAHLTLEYESDEE